MTEPTMISITFGDLDNLRHMLGVGPRIPRRSWGYRNHYHPSTETIESMRRLEASGLARPGRAGLDGLGLPCYHATDLGMQFLGFSDAEIARIKRDR